MSLTSLINGADAREKFKPLRPKLSRRIPGEMKAPPVSVTHSSVIGTAFDYLLRFELKRRAPHAKDEKWIAEHVATNDFLDKEITARAKRVISAAKKTLKGFRAKSREPSTEILRALAEHALQLARLDPIYRAGYIEPDLDKKPDDKDVDDLLAMLEVVPFNELLTDNRMLLNPEFGDSSGLVGGADADLISGDFLVDIKTTRKPSMSSKDLDQLLGYFLLSRNELRNWRDQERSPNEIFDSFFKRDSKQKRSLRRSYNAASPGIKQSILNSLDPGPPEIERAGLYFARYGYLWSIDVGVWLDNPKFYEAEKWFVERINLSWMRKVDWPER